VGGLVADGFGDGLGHELALGGAGELGGVAGAGEVAAFDDDGGDDGVTSEAEAAADEAGAGAGGADAAHLLLEAAGEGVAIGAPVVGLGAGAAAAAVVEMDADEDGIGVTIGDADAVIEIDEVVVATDHDDFEAGGKLGADALGEIEGEVFFDEATGAGTGVFAAMAGIDDDGGEATGAGAVTINAAFFGS